MNLRRLIAVVLASASAGVSQAATFTVSDGDVAGLITAITMANTNGEDDVINLPANGTYTLVTANNTDTGANGLPLLRTDGGHSITFNGNRTTIRRGVVGSSFRIFQIAASANVTMRGLIISNGAIGETPGFSASGGGISNNNGTLTLVNCTITGNSASSTQTGAAVASGGGINNNGGTLTLQNCTLRGNSVSTRSNNGSSAISSGGAIENFDGTVRLSNCTVSGNSTSASSGSGIMGLPDASGGAISNFGSAAGNGTVTMNSCTFAQNSSMNSGGFGGTSIAIENGGPTARITFGNCLLSNVTFSNFQGTITSAGYNLSDGNGGGFLLGTADQINTNPMLGGIGLHGGQTETHQPLPGSPAIDKGKRDAVPALAVTTDQTGLARPFDYPGVGPAIGGDSSDIGAVEMNEFAQTGNIFTVNTLDDHGDSLCGTRDCSLRDALKAAADQAGTDTIRFAVDLMGTIELRSALPIIATDLNIEGPGANILAVARSATASEFRIFNLDHVTARISGLTIRDGKLTPSGSLGAGIYNNGGTLTLTSCTLNGNQGYAAGGLYNGGGSATVANCTFHENTAFEGGGIDNAAIGNASSMTVTNSTFSGNSASNNGGAVTNSAFAGTASSTLLNCTFSGNNAPTGSAVSNGASTFGGTPAAATTFLVNNIVKQGTMGPNFSNASGTNAAASLISLGHNISSDDAGGGAGTAPGGFLSGMGDLRNTDPMLSAGGLADNGGGTPTIALDPGSPAINNAVNAPARDQRDYLRNGAADIGAFELGGKIAVTLGNISTRVRVETGDNVLIGGFIISGTRDKRIIVRAIGPSLPVPGTLANPKLQLFNASGMIGSNDNWRSDQQAEIMATGIAPTNDLEAALIKTVPPGGYTVIVSGVGGSTGVGLVEVHDLDLTANSKFANISSRALVQTGDNVLIGGFIISGQDMQKVVIRAIGPSLTPLGVPGALQDPTLELHDAMGNVTSNDDWQATQAAEISEAGLAPNDSRESAIFATLAPGGYTAIVRGKANTIGVGLVEVYVAR